MTNVIKGWRFTDEFEQGVHDFTQGHTPGDAIAPGVSKEWKEGKKNTRYDISQVLSVLLRFGDGSVINGNELLNEGIEWPAKYAESKNFLDSFEKNVLFKILEEYPITSVNLENDFDKISRIESAISDLMDKGLIRRYEEEGEVFIDIGESVDIPLKLSQRSLLAAEDIPEPVSEKVSQDQKKNKIIDKEKALKILKTFGEIETIEEKTVYYPYWIAEMVKDEESRILAIDGVLGERDEYVERMFRRRVY